MAIIFSLLLPLCGRASCLRWVRDQGVRLLAWKLNEHAGMEEKMLAELDWPATSGERIAAFFDLLSDNFPDYVQELQGTARKGISPAERQKAQAQYDAFMRENAALFAGVKGAAILPITQRAQIIGRIVAHPNTTPRTLQRVALWLFSHPQVVLREESAQAQILVDQIVTRLMNNRQYDSLETIFYQYQEQKNFAKMSDLLSRVPQEAQRKFIDIVRNGWSIDLAQRLAYLKTYLLNPEADPIYKRSVIGQWVLAHRSKAAELAQIHEMLWEVLRPEEAARKKQPLLDADAEIDAPRLVRIDYFQLERYAPLSEEQYLTYIALSRGPDLFSMRLALAYRLEGLVVRNRETISEEMRVCARIFAALRLRETELGLPPSDFTYLLHVRIPAHVQALFKIP